MLARIIAWTTRPSEAARIWMAILLLLALSYVLKPRDIAQFVSRILSELDR